MTVREVLQQARRLTNSDSARLDVEVLLAHVLKKERSFFFAYPEYVLTDAQAESIDRLLARREAGEPIAYLIGEKEFWSLPFAVSTATLIPRPETELLVELALRYLDGAKAKRCLDLGTGTGAVALALAHSKPEHRFVAVDAIPEAAALAKHNAKVLEAQNVKILVSDWFCALNNHDRFDVIVSNPPYIDPSDPHLDQGDVAYEPKSALVSAKHGLLDIQRIIQDAPNFLSKNGVLLLEHGWQQAEAVRQLFTERGFAAVQTEADLAGLDRVTSGMWP